MRHLNYFFTVIDLLFRSIRVASIVTRLTRCPTEESVFDFLIGQEIFVYSKASRPSPRTARADTRSSSAWFCFSDDWGDWSVKLNTHPFLSPRLGMTGAVPPVPPLCPCLAQAQPYVVPYKNEYIKQSISNRTC